MSICNLSVGAYISFLCICPVETTNLFLRRSIDKELSFGRTLKVFYKRQQLCLDFTFLLLVEKNCNLKISQFFLLLTLRQTSQQNKTD